MAKVPKKNKIFSAEVPVQEVSTKKIKEVLNIDKGIKKTKKTAMLILFKIEGKEGYRSSQYETKEVFNAYLAAPGQINHGRVTERKWFVIDFTNGTITPEK